MFGARGREARGIDTGAWRPDGRAMKCNVGRHIASWWLASFLVLVLTPAARAATKAPSLLLAKVWDDSIDPTGWWISEKFDGVRGYWDGQALKTRGGNVVRAPDYFLAELPAGIPLDGELWMGRGRFEETASTVLRDRPDDRWRVVRFMIFDAPGLKASFEERVAFIKRTLAPDARHVRPVLHYRCEGRAHLLAERDRVVTAGGEGLMLRKPESRYVPGRSPSLLKVKTHDDAEAVVTAHLPGKGRNAGRMGSLRVRMADGREFSVGTGFTDTQRADPPAVGAVITFRYRGYTKNGLPRFPSFLRVKADVE